MSARNDGHNCCQFMCPHDGAECSMIHDDAGYFFFICYGSGYYSFTVVVTKAIPAIPAASHSYYEDCMANEIFQHVACGSARCAYTRIANEEIEQVGDCLRCNNLI